MCKNEGREHPAAKWLGYEAFKQEMEPLRQCAYVIVSKPAREAEVVKEVLTEISLQRQSESLAYFAIKDFSHPGRYEAFSMNEEKAAAFEKTWQSWAANTASDQLQERLENLRTEWPEYISYGTGLLDYLLANAQSSREQIECILPKRLNASLCPVIACKNLQNLAGHEKDGAWQAGDQEKALGGCLLINARQLYQNQAAWQLLCEELASGRIACGLNAPFDVQIILYGSAELYQVWSEEDADFAAFFSETRCFPDAVPNSAGSRARWFEFIRQSFQQLITDKALEFLLALISGLDFQSMENGDGFLPGCFDAADPWISECQWVCHEKGTDLVNIAIVKQVWQSRQRRTHLMQQILEPPRLPQGELVGSVYGLALRDLKYCYVVEPVRIAVTSADAQPRQGEKKRLGLRPRRKRERMEVLLESVRPFEGGSCNLTAAMTYAVLSAMGGYPVRQRIAVIGDVDDGGNLRPVGQAEELVRGFYDLCLRRGWENAGMVLPAANMLELRLPLEVQQAMQEDRFFLYPARTVMDGAEVLMRRPGSAERR